MPNLTAEDEAAAMVAAVRDDPAQRLELAARFYDGGTGRRSIPLLPASRAGLHALAGQTAGVLAGPSADRPGSPWWRAVDERLLRDAWQARLLVSGQPGTASRPSVTDWVCFLETALGADVVPGPQCQHRRRVPRPPRPAPGRSSR